MTPKTKVYYNGIPLRTNKGRFSSLKTLAKKVWFYAKVAGVLVAVNVIISTGAVVYFSTTTVQASTTILQAPTTFDAPVMNSIAQCESNSHQFGPSGQTLMKANTNNTVDVGKYQINTVYFAKASKLGYDLTTEEGNTKMAYWIYENVGTQPWYSSAKCWNK